MEENDTPQSTNIEPKIKDGISYIRCTYEIKDINEVQIMNDRSENYSNDEIASKIQILNGDEKEELK